MEKFSIAVLRAFSASATAATDDSENVQPKNLEILSNHPFKVFVFVGASQAKIPFELAAAMQHLGDDAQYVKIGGNGKNALDFHLAFYVGELVAKDPEAYHYPG